MAQNKQLPQNEDERNDLLATIAASRELGPDMDETLANRYLEERQKADARVRKTQSSAQLTPMEPMQQGIADARRRAAFFAPVGGLVIAGIIIAAIATHTWALFGLLWVGLFLFGPRFFGRRWRQDRWGRRYYRRYGPYSAYDPNSYDGSLPSGASTPTTGYAQSQGYQQLPQPGQRSAPVQQPAPAKPTPVTPPPQTTAPAPRQPMPPVNPAG